MNLWRQPLQAKRSSTTVCNRNQYISGVFSRYLLITLLFPIATSCGKRNYLTVGRQALIQSTNGMIIRSQPNATSKSIGVVPNNGIVSVLSEGPDAKLFEISSRWYKVQFGNINGWMWGGFSKPVDGLQESHDGPQDRADQIPSAPQLPPSEKLVVAWVSINEYCTELYSSPYATISDSEWIKSAYQDSGLRTDKVTIVPRCIDWKARSIVQIDAIKNPPKSDSESSRIMQKHTIVCYDYSLERQTTNEEYVRLFSSRGADVKVIK